MDNVQVTDQRVGKFILVQLSGLYRPAEEYPELKNKFLNHTNLHSDRVGGGYGGNVMHFGFSVKEDDDLEKIDSGLTLFCVEYSDLKPQVTVQEGSFFI